eukprot:7929925-Pyramimonas_sp.AAC.1
MREAKLEPNSTSQAPDPISAREKEGEVRAQCDHLKFWDQCKMAEGEVGARRGHLQSWDQGMSWRDVAKSQPDVANGPRAVYSESSQAFPCEKRKAQVEPDAICLAPAQAKVREMAGSEVRALRDHWQCWDQGMCVAKSQPDVAGAPRAVYSESPQALRCEKRTAELEPDTASLAPDPAT